MSTRPVFVVFEGLDGTGKTTIAKRVAKAIGAVYGTTPEGRLRENREQIIESFGGCREAAQHLYLASVFAASHNVQLLRAQGQSVVLDRYFISTEAYPAFRGSNTRHDDQCTLLEPADVTVFPYASLEVRRSRLERRGQTNGDRETLGAEADAG